jgi:hypothetical protein
MKPVLLCTLTIFLTATALSQDLRSVFISANTGIFLTAHENFSKVYDSNTGIVFGGTLGLPLSTRTYLYGKATYFSKRGVPVIATFAIQNGTPILISETRSGTATFRQWIFDAGLQYNLFLTEMFTIGFNGGLAYSTLSEEQRSADGSFSSSTSGIGSFGFFAGAALEKNFRGVPLSIVLEPQYNYSRRDLVGIIGDYGGLNISLGIRFYFSDRRLQ